MSATTPSHAAGSKQPALWLALAVALALSFAVDGPVMALVKPLHDSRVTDLIHATIRWLGTGYVQIPVAVIMIAAGALWSVRLKRAGGWALLAFIISGAAVNILKLLVHRARPYTPDPRPDTWLGYVHNSAFQSFPSAESATTFAVAFTLMGWYPALRWPLTVIALCVGVGRVLVGGHHPSDVMAGAILGVVVARLVSSWANRPRREATNVSA